LANKQRIDFREGISSSPLSEEEKQGDSIVERWLAETFEYKLRNASLVTKQTHRPILLYRNTIEESESALQEQIGLIVGKQVVIIVYAYGGFLPSTFQKVEVHTIDKFITWIVKKGKRDLLLQCLENIHKIPVVIK
jgi:hypothetical protein